MVRTQHLHAMEQSGLHHKAAYVFLSTFKMIDVMRKNIFKIMDAQRARGVETEGNVFVRAKAFVPIIIPLVVNAMLEVGERALTLESKAFSVQCEKTIMIPATRNGYEKRALTDFRDYRTLRNRRNHCMADKIIELKNVTYTYPLVNHPAVKNITLSLEAGKLYGIIGGNGSGKTTLCVIVCGFATKFEKGKLKGEVLIKGKDIRLLRTWRSIQNDGICAAESVQPDFRCQRDGTGRDCLWTRKPWSQSGRNGRKSCKYRKEDGY